MVEHSGTVIMVPNLDHLKKGGRITPAVALLAGMLKIVPVMELNYKLGGKIDTLTKVRTVKKATRDTVGICSLKCLLWLFYCVRSSYSVWPNES